MEQFLQFKLINLSFASYEKDIRLIVVKTVGLRNGKEFKFPSNFIIMTVIASITLWKISNCYVRIATL